jgi:hypothetical protein
MTPRLKGASWWLGVLSAAPLAAQTAPPANSASIYAGYEKGNTDSQRIDAGASFRFHDHTGFGVAVARAEAQFDEDQATSTYVIARASREFGAFGVGLGIRRGEVEDISRTRGWFASGSFDYRQLRISGEIEIRESEIARTPFSEDFGGDLGVISGTSRCDGDSVGYHAQLNLDRPRWSLNASARIYDYAQFDCELSDVDLPGGLTPPGNSRGRGRALGRRLAADAFERVSGFASRLTPRESTLLASSISVGFMMPVNDRWYGGADLYRDVEELEDNAFATALVFAGVRLTDAWSCEFSLGHTDAESIEDTSFVGVRVTATL